MIGFKDEGLDSSEIGQSEYLGLFVIKIFVLFTFNFFGDVGCEFIREALVIFSPVNAGKLGGRGLRFRGSQQNLSAFQPAIIAGKHGFAMRVQMFFLHWHGDARDVLVVQAFDEEQHIRGNTLHNDLIFEKSLLQES